MTKQSRKAKALIKGVLRGIESVADTFQVNRYSYPHASELEAIHGDWQRVGDDMRLVIKRTNAKAAA